MTQVKIIKDYKMLKVGETPNVDDLYAAALIKRGVAESPKAKKK